MVSEGFQRPCGFRGGFRVLERSETVQGFNGVLVSERLKTCFRGVLRVNFFSEDSHVNNLGSVAFM